jgi:hypothetical protein
MPKIILIALSCSLTMLFASCNYIYIPTHFDRLSLLHKGMDANAVNTLIKDNEWSSLRMIQTDIGSSTEGVQSHIVWTVPNTDYTVKTVSVHTLNVERSDPTSGDRRGFKTREYSKNSTFRLIFKAGKLEYWGFDYELAMSDDPELQRIANLLHDSYK